jgi:hypothetical protein
MPIAIVCHSPDLSLEAVQLGDGEDGLNGHGTS